MKSSSMSHKLAFRLCQKALHTFLDNIKPNGFVIRDEETQKDYIVLINDMNELVIDEAEGVEAESDCTIVEVRPIYQQSLSVH